MALSTETRGIIESLLQNNKVVLFMKGTPQQPQCGFSASTVSTLEMLVPEYMTINILEHPEIRDGIKEFSNWPTIPQLYVNGELIGGNDIVQDMLRSGELGDVLGVAAPEVGVPEIQVADAAIEVIRNALQSQKGANIHLQISASWSHMLSLDASKTGPIQIDVAGIQLHMDPWSAARSHGLKIELNETLTGRSFVFDNPNAPPPVKQITVHDLKKMLDDDLDVLLIDVRGPEERAVEYIEGSVPWDDDTMARIESLPKDAEIIFHCQTGPRSQALAEQCRSRGYTNLCNVTGGISAWSKEVDAG